MKKVLIYSIQPEPIKNILSGSKTIEIRKRTLPQWALDVIAQGGVVEGYGYCTKGGDLLTGAWNKGVYEYYTEYKRFKNDMYVPILNGKVVVKFQVGGVTKLEYDMSEDYFGEVDGNPLFDEDKICKFSCLDEIELSEYLDNGCKIGYAHHLTHIEAVNMELREFYKTIHYPESNEYFTPHICEYKNVLKCYQKIQEECLKSFILKRPPQSFMTAWVKGE